METIGTLWIWIGFTVFVLAMLALDLGVVPRKAHAVSLKESLAGGNDRGGRGAHSPLGKTGSDAAALRTHCAFAQAEESGPLF